MTASRQLLRASLPFLLFSLAWGKIATGASVTETFASPDAASGTTGVWNVVQGALHVPFVVNRFLEGPAQDTVDIGTGEDGPFDATTMATFDIDGGTPSIITLDTTLVYQFTEFTLPAGITIRGQGNSALRIRVQGDATLYGDIDLSGGDGGDSFAPAAATLNGGTSCCRGADGGSGASTVVTGADTVGDSPMGGVDGGGAGGVSAVGGVDGSGGGGGGNLYNGDVGAGPSGGALGPLYGDVLLDDLRGGAGGGGGGGNSAGNTAGAGGGGGGGAMLFHVGGNFYNEGTIDVTGGDGGDGQAAHDAGGGGGGAGGSVQIFAGGTGINNGLIDSRAGSGGSGTNAGGIGSDGIPRFAFVGGDFTSTSSPAGVEDPRPGFLPRHATQYSTDAVIVVSPIYDTQSANPYYRPIVRDEVVYGSDSVQIEVAGSNDSFATDDTGYVSEDVLEQIQGKRYFRFRVTLQSGYGTTTPLVRSLTFPFHTMFDYSIAGCARAAGPWQRSRGDKMWAWIFGWLFLITVAAPRVWARSLPSPSPRLD